MKIEFRKLTDDEVFRNTIEILERRIKNRKIHRFIFRHCKKCSNEMGLITRLREIKNEGKTE